MTKNTKKVHVPSQQDEMSGYVSNTNEKLTTRGLARKRRGTESVSFVKSAFRTPLFSKPRRSANLNVN
jgi:hypothetical protein